MRMSLGAAVGTVPAPDFVVAELVAAAAAAVVFGGL